MSNDLLIQEALAALATGNTTERTNALRHLRGHKDARIAPALIPFLRDPDPTIRLLTVETLGMNGDDSAIRDLIDLLYDDQPHIRAAAADALGQMNAKSAVSALIDLLYDESIIARFAAAVALALIADPRAVVDLIHVLDHEDIPLAMMAAQALRHIGTTEALAAIQHLREGDSYNFETHEHEEFVDQTLRRIPRDLVKRYLDAVAADPAVKNMTIDAFRAYVETQLAEQPPSDGLLNKENAEPAFDDDMRGGGISPDWQADEDDGYDDEPRRAIPPGALDDYLREQEAEADTPSTSSQQPPEREEEHQSAEPPRPTPLNPPTGISRPTSPITQPPAPLSAVEFSAYFPREIQPNTWQPLRAYVYKPQAQSAVAADAAAELGALLSGYREVARPAQTRITEGALITATPELPGFQFNPPTAQIAFYDDWQRFDFRLRATSAPLDHAANGRITFSVEGIIIADVPLAIYVGASAAQPAPVSSARPIYQSIFCSYSHRDTQIVERIEKAYKVLGFTSLRDVLTLKSGQNWDAELLRLIDQADIFQLFWSTAASQSKAVRKEWLYALQRRALRPDFVRPVFWEQPMPPPPPELSPIHFAFEPTLDDE